MRRKICVVTGSRADYGILRGLMKEIQADPSLELTVVATGMHLSPEFGHTEQNIEADGFQIQYRVESLLSSDTPTGVSKSVGLGVIGFADAFRQIQPDLIVLLGDRFEILAAAQAAMIGRCPIAHLHGGEITEGAVDESIRHAITKMSHLHFVSAEVHRGRVIQLGETPERVFNFGAPGLDAIHELKFLERTEFEQKFGVKWGSLNFLVTYHPVTLGSRDSVQALGELFNALDQFPKAHVLFTKPNADAEGRKISQLIDEYKAKYAGRVQVITSLGQLGYLSAVRIADVVIGNSSSGLIEAPALKKPTVNIGDRQKGRLRGSTVIDCTESAPEIIKAIQRALSSEFRATLASAKSPYGDGSASKHIKQVLASTDLAALTRKPFFDLPQAKGSS
jgi:UDP-hydrolysing UDP-N-acetyl-D-glucosamine 2-epimerase